MKKLSCIKYSFTLIKLVLPITVVVADIIGCKGDVVVAGITSIGGGVSDI